MEKVKFSKERIQQLQKQLDIQKEIVNQKESAIEALLVKMDSIVEINEERNNEILALNNELKYYQDQVTFDDWVHIGWFDSGNRLL